jgi:diguanylate cyclase (GGDEF)-like protein
LQEVTLKKPTTPSDEAHRLETLHALNLLDTDPEERFDRLTRMARHLFSVPIAVVSLTDRDRQWFKSCVGLDARETSRDLSFCGHAILGDDIFIVYNAAEDPRFMDNPLVIDGPAFRFYAGCPIKAPNGSKLGTLCILDHEPRDFSTEDLQALRDLAAMVESEIAAIEMATFDELTAISNRRGFMILAQHSLSLCARQEIPATLLFMDLNDFKYINDQLGHATGDQALIGFADTMKRTFRTSDICARLGGDEFALWLDNTTREGAIQKAERLLALRDDLQEVAGFTDPPLSMSLGIVLTDPGAADDLNSLFDRADHAMYSAKNRGKSGYAVAEPVHIRETG